MHPQQSTRKLLVFLFTIKPTCSFPFQICIKPLLPPSKKVIEIHIYCIFPFSPLFTDIEQICFNLSFISLSLALYYFFILLRKLHFPKCCHLSQVAHRYYSSQPIVTLINQGFHIMLLIKQRHSSEGQQNCIQGRISC